MQSTKVYVHYELRQALATAWCISHTACVYTLTFQRGEHSVLGKICDLMNFLEGKIGT